MSEQITHSHMNDIDLGVSVRTIEEIGSWKVKSFYMENTAKRYWLMNKQKEICLRT